MEKLRFQHIMKGKSSPSSSPVSNSPISGSPVPGSPTTASFTPVLRDRGLEVLGSHSTHANADVILIHGIQGSSKSTWTNTDYDIFWPDYLVEDIKNIHVFTWSYDSSIQVFQSSSSTASIDSYSDNLLVDLANMRDSANHQDRPIFFIAHSLGGLVCANALIRASLKAESGIKNVADMTRGIVFLGTPHEGSDVAKWAKLLTNFLQLSNDSATKRNIELLMKDSKKLREISENLANLLRKRGESKDPTQKINVICFWEEHPMKRIGGIQVVPRESAVIKGYDGVCIPGDHCAMVRFSSKSSVGYKRISESLKKWVKEATAQQPTEGVREVYNMKIWGGNAIGKLNGNKQRFYAANNYGDNVARMAIEAQRVEDSGHSEEDN